MIARVLAILRVNRNGASILDVKARTASGALWYEHAQPAGVDAPPLEGVDSALVHPAEGTGRGTISGYFDPGNTGTAIGGEFRVYSRGEVGEVRAQGHLFQDGTIRLWNSKGTIEIDPDGQIQIFNDSVALELKPDGEASVSNGSGSVKLEGDGTVNINGWTFGPNGVGTGAGGQQFPLSGDVRTEANVSLDLHGHPQVLDSAGHTQGNSEAPTPE